MSGGENYFAGALFFSLVTFSAIIKIEGIEGLALGVCGAFLAGFFLRQALSQMFEDSEDNYRHLELQIQELKRNGNNPAPEALKIAEISTLVNRSLQDFETRLHELEMLAETNAAISASVKKIEDSTSAIYFALKALADFIPPEVQKIHRSDELNRQTLLTAANILQTLDTLLKNPDFEKNISELSRVNAEVFSQNQNLIDAAKNLNSSVDSLKTINEQLLTSTTNLRAVFEDIESAKETE